MTTFTDKVDLAAIKVGDEITIRARVHEMCGAGIKVRSLAGDHESYVRPEHIVSHTPKPLAVGDRVKVNRDGAVWVIRAIHEQWAWIFTDSSDSGDLFSLSDLERSA